MTATDFMYDGLFLSDLGYIVCQFDESGGFSSSSAGSQLDLTTVSVMGGKKYEITGVQYSEPFNTSISICKPDGAAFTIDEFEYLLRWLNRPEYHELILRTADFGAVRFFGTFNVDKVEFRGRLIGFTLNFISDSPFGKYPQEVDKFVISKPGGSIVIYDKSSEVGYVYPDYLEIECTGSGDLVIENSLDGRKTIIENCVIGEVITMDGTVASLSSSKREKILNSFNFRFPRICNTIVSSENKWTFSLPCKVTVKYSPIRKVVF